LIANPGCYPTAAILAIAPLLVSGLVETENIIIDAKSGLTGAGRRASVDFFFSEINENLKPYKLNSHQHMPEIEQELSKVAGKNIALTFCPHIAPLNRGIEETIYCKPKAKATEEEVLKVYKRFFQLEPFVRVSGREIPSIKNVSGTNFCDIYAKLDKKKNVLIVISVIDNLLKGAAGQAVQNMNIMCGLPETSGLV
jgi:N-acetyl-gamma-glutamyl-phosphate reductase